MMNDYEKYAVANGIGSKTFLRRNACHCLIFCSSMPNSSVKPNGVLDGMPVPRRAKVARIACASSAPSKPECCAKIHRS